MDDHSQDNQNALDARLRATFGAERSDIERRHLADNTPGASSPNRNWMPLAIAAAIIAIGGFFFIGNRTTNEAVDLDVAAQSGEGNDGQPDTPGNPNGTQGSATSAPAEPALAGEPGEIPWLTGENLCGTEFHPDTTVVWSDNGQPVALSAVPFVGETQPEPVFSTHTVEAADRLSSIAAQYNVTAEAILAANPEVIPDLIIEGQELAIPPASANPTTVASGSELELTGGCTAGGIGVATITWIEVAIDQSRLWIPSESLVTPDVYNRLSGGVAVPAPSPAVQPVPGSPNECGFDIEPFSPRFIWGIGINDPDGGLVAHTEPGIEAPVTRVVPMNGVVFVTGGCALSPNGTPWFEIDGGNQFEWVSGNFLETPAPACLFGEAVGSSTPDGSGDEQIFGPREGEAIVLGDVTAFTDFSSDTYQFYGDTTAVVIGVPCYLEGATGPVCITGSYALIDLMEPEPIASGEGPVTARLTGRTYAPLDRRGLVDPLVEVAVGEGADIVFGFVPSGEVLLTSGTCDNISLSDSLTERPCAIIESTLEENSGLAGSAESEADHVRRISVQETPTCTRVVIEFGIDSFTPQERAAAILPEINVRKDTRGTTLRFPSCAQTSACGLFVGENQPDRVDFDGGTVFVALDTNQQPYIQIFANGIASVTPQSSPARIIFDVQPDSAADSNAPVVLDDVILREPVDAAGTSQLVQGWARPFEASGLWYVFEISPEGTLSENPAAIASGLLQTTGWFMWGEFEVELPDLPDGDYLVAFGEAPPAGDSAFIGSGQRIRVSTGEPGIGPTWETFVDRLEITDPILILE